MERLLGVELGRHDYPLTLIPDGDDDDDTAKGKCGWAFWVLENDPTSYVHEDLSVEWYGTMWDGDDAGVTP